MLSETIVLLKKNDDVICPRWCQVIQNPKCKFNNGYQFKFLCVLVICRQNPRPISTKEESTRI